MVKKKVIDHPYMSHSLPDYTPFVSIREDIPVFRAGLPDFWGGQGQADTYPSVVALRRSSSKTATQWPKQRLSKDWMLFVRELNMHNNGLPVDVIFKVEAGWINGLKDPTQQINPYEIEQMGEDDMPKPEFITTSGSIHVMEERTSTAVRLSTFKIGDTPPDPNSFNNETANPYIVHMMAGHKDGFYVNISSGSSNGQAQEVYFPLLCPGDAWVLFKDRFCDNRVEFLPSLPMTITMNATLTIRETPSVSANGVGYIPTGYDVRISKYYPSTTGVWGWMGEGWIAIQYLPYKGYSSTNYFTNWKLETLPALRPRHSFS